MGRPSKFSEERAAEIVRMVRLAVPVSVAAGAAGISERTFYRWCEEGQKASSGRFRQFWQALQQAQAEAEATLVLRLQQAVRDGDLSQARWILERRFGWARQERHEISGPEAGPIEVETRREITADRAAEIINLLDEAHYFDDARDRRLRVVEDPPDDLGDAEAL